MQNHSAARADPLPASSEWRRRNGREGVLKSCLNQRKRGITRNEVLVSLVLGFLLFFLVKPVHRLHP
jgi:hypothetical protein